MYRESNIYYYPEKSGLQQLASLEFSNQDYCFDTRVVWQRLADGVLLTARDSGCSCPSPFEDTKLSDLAEVESTGWLREEVEATLKDVRDYGFSCNPLLLQESSEFFTKIEKHLNDRKRSRNV